MKTLQTKGAAMEHTMLRRIIIGLTTGIALAFSVLGSVTPADAQSGPMCDRFGPGAAGLAGWGACPAAPNITVTTSNSGSIAGASDYYLLLTDLSGASAACSTDEKYLGDWVQKMGGCGQFCFDFKVFNSGSPPGPITPSFTIWSGTSHATFVANFTVTANDPWRQHICAPVNLSATPPSGPQGHWVVTGNWNSIITNVTMIQLPIDFTSQPSEVAGYDNLCMNPQACPPPPPVIDGCLKDSKVTVTCNPDGTYTLTLSGSGFTGTTITLTSQTAGVTVTPPQQPWAATTTWTINGASPGQTVILTANATNVGGGSEPGTDQCCSGQITIVMPDCPKPRVGEVVVEKKVKNDTRAPASVINSLVFPIGLSCTAPSNLNVSFGLNNGGTHTENNVPYTSICTVTESVSTLPPVPKDVCGEGSTAVWLPPVITVIPSATIGAPVTTFTVVNELKCEKVGSLIVTKQVIYDGPITLPSQVYPVTVNCDGTITHLNLVNGVPQTVNNISLPASCSVVEGPVPTPPNICPPRTTPMWTTVYVPPSPIPVTGLGATELVKNTLTCSPIHTNTCPPPQVPNAAGVCTCPPPLVPILGAVCGCPPGTVLRGKECVRPPKCDPPLVVGPDGACGCPEGTVQQGRRCVAPPKCTPPMVLGPDGKTCRCPEGMTQQRGRCVAPPKCTPPMVLGPDGKTCRCPEGMTQLRGRCVTPPKCTPPMTLGPDGKTCRCPEGTTQRGNTCVRRITCTPPAHPNSQGTACICPDGMKAEGNGCVRVPRDPVPSPRHPGEPGPNPRAPLR